MSGSYQFSQSKDSTWHISGELTRLSVPALWPEGIAAILKAKDTIVIDLANIHESDSAGVALLIEWMRIAKKNHKAIFFQNINMAMQSIIRVSRLEPILAPVTRKQDQGMANT